MAVTGGSREGALASRPWSDTLGLIAGVLGGTSVLFAVALYVLDPQVWRLAAGNLGFGLACLIVYLVTHRGQLGRAVSGRSTPLVALEVVMAIGVLGGAAALNFVAAKSPKEWDLTRDGIYSLHPQSLEVAKELDRRIDVVGFYGPAESTREMLTQAVEMYSAHTPHLRLRFVDPDRATQKDIDRYKITSRSARIVIEDPDSERFTKVKRVSEEALTQGLIEVTRRRERKVYFLTGHGEPALDDEADEGFARARDLIGNEGLSVETLELVGRSDVPEDASAVVVAGPAAALLPNEVEAIKAWLDRGGRALFLLEPGRPHGLERVLKPYGVAVGDDLILDDNPAARALGLGADAPVVQSYETHPITRVMGKSFTLFYRARSVTPRVGLANLSVTTLIQTSPSSWAETRYKDESFSLDEEDLAGPVPIAVAAVKRTSTHPRRIAEEARLVVIGDHHFATNRFTAMSGNVNLFVNTLNWLVGDEGRITIRPPKRAGARLPLTEAQQLGITLFSVNLLPLLVTGLGLSVWALRRRR